MLEFCPFTDKQERSSNRAAYSAVIRLSGGAAPACAGSADVWNQVGARVQQAPDVSDAWVQDARAPSAISGQAAIWRSRGCGAGCARPGRSRSRGNQGLQEGASAP